MVIEELCPFLLLFLFLVPFGTYLDDDEDIGILVKLASCFCLLELNGFVINKVFEYSNNVARNFLALHKIKNYFIILRSSLWIRL